MSVGLHDAWWRLVSSPPRGIADRCLTSLLRTASWVYGLGVATRNAGYDLGRVRTERLGCPVISIGNISVGGTGKTTYVESLARRLMSQGKRVGILTRGYGGRLPQPYWLQSEGGVLLLNGRPLTDSADAGSIGRLPRGSRSSLAACGEVADEARLLAEHLNGVPVIVGRRREVTGRWALGSAAQGTPSAARIVPPRSALGEFRPDVLLLDDGFQYRRLARDCNIVLLSARMPIGGWPLLPAGPLREPLSSLRRAQVIILTKADQALDRVAALQESLQRRYPDALIVTAAHEPEGIVDADSGVIVPAQQVAKSRLALLSSVGDPEGFEQSVAELGASVAWHRPYPDHYRYRPEDWDAIQSAASAAGATAILTTEKDLMRLRPLRDRAKARTLPLWVARVRFRIFDGEDRVDARLAALLAR